MSNPETGHTPLPWWIRRNPKNPDEGILVAKPTTDHPYGKSCTTIDILGDEDYPRKMADMELIEQAVNSHAALMEAARALSAVTADFSGQDYALAEKYPEVVTTIRVRAKYMSAARSALAELEKAGIKL